MEGAYIPWLASNRIVGAYSTWKATRPNGALTITTAPIVLSLGKPQPIQPGLLPEKRESSVAEALHSPRKCVAALLAAESFRQTEGRMLVFGW